MIDQFHRAVNPGAWSTPSPTAARTPAALVENSAFVHRHVDMDIVIDGCWRNEEETREGTGPRIDGLYDLPRPYMNGHVYQTTPTGL